MSSESPGTPDRLRRRFVQVVRLRGRDSRFPIDPDLSADDPSEPGAGHRPASYPIHRADPAILASIGAGGFLGALGRYEMGLAFPASPGAFPFTTFAINTSGAFALGVILTLILERFASSRYLRPFACVGVLGAWTTMSTLATESAVLLKDGHVPTALAYMPQHSCAASAQRSSALGSPGKGRRRDTRRLRRCHGCRGRDRAVPHRRHGAGSIAGSAPAGNADGQCRRFASDGIRHRAAALPRCRHAPVAVVGTGFCGGLTTWSTASWETVRLLEEGEGPAAFLNAIGGLAASLAAAACGLLLAAI